MELLLDRKVATCASELRDVYCVRFANGVAHRWENTTVPFLKRVAHFEQKGERFGVKHKFVLKVVFKNRKTHVLEVSGPLPAVLQPKHEVCSSYDSVVMSV